MVTIFSLRSLMMLGTVLGGLGLFLLAVRMISDGFKVAGGSQLREILATSTSTVGRGIFSGMVFTGIVQSSSAVTVATIGFVNAGMLSLHQAMGVIFGANIGTTMTGWLVAAVGFNLKLETLALPLIGLGMFFSLIWKGGRGRGLGEALAGFGLFFIGIDILREAFETIASTLDMQEISGSGVAGVLLSLAGGFLMTVLTQSSSAAIALILTAATGGVLAINSAAAMVIGANIGTTSTAIFAVIGATSNAKRVASAHILFNVLTAAVALLMLPLMLYLVGSVSHLLLDEDSPAVLLALFHTVFNVLGVLLMLPLSRRMAAFLENRFRTIDEIEGRPKYLDRNIAATPALVVDALSHEIERLAGIARRLCQASLSTEREVAAHIESDRHVVQSLSTAIGSFISSMDHRNLTEDVLEGMPVVLQTSQYFLRASDLAGLIAYAQDQVQHIREPHAREAIAALNGGAAQLLEHADIGRDDYSIDGAESELEALTDTYKQARNAVLQAAASGRVSIDTLAEVLEQLNRTRRMARQFVKGMRHLANFYPDHQAGAVDTGSEQTEE